ncbi:hypothetical protein CEXT_441641 [Caerostris extrusa]|uniref:Uncharacterized protein n=1 Tax=Caerostris extrusa TaxID=172846 RepID=A0AAV4XAG9_CAEEX|nr:hypothetical protein CEXT_441641 [Caerostris extrusa]
MSLLIILGPTWISEWLIQFMDLWGRNTVLALYEIKDKKKQKNRIFTKSFLSGHRSREKRPCFKIGMLPPPSYIDLAFPSDLSPTLLIDYIHKKGGGQ